MTNTQFNSVIRLRRDNDYNYAKIKDKFVPQKGEICLVDTARDGLRAVCGDGVSTFGQLDFMGDVIKKGYYKDNAFYKYIIEQWFIGNIQTMTFDFTLTFMEKTFVFEYSGDGTGVIKAR